MLKAAEQSRLHSRSICSVPRKFDYKKMIRFLASGIKNNSRNENDSNVIQKRRQRGSVVRVGDLKADNPRTQNSAYWMYLSLVTPGRNSPGFLK